MPDKYEDTNWPLSYRHLSEARKPDRAEISEGIAALARFYGMEVTVGTEEKRELRISFHDPKTKLGGDVTLHGNTVQRRHDIFVVPWYFGPGYDKSIKLRVWFTPRVNNCHYHKATDVFDDVTSLLGILQIRFRDIRSGAAFQPEQ